MNIDQAVSALGALAHPHRLAVFRLLVAMGPDGLAAGKISEQVGISAAAASFHLKELDRAGLIFGTRDGRHIRYAAHIQGIRQLLAYLSEDCCQGQPELCGEFFGTSDFTASNRRSGMSTTPIYNVLFLCTHNSARSVIAECIVNRLGAGRLKGFSAGSAPRGTIHPYALDLLTKLNYDTRNLRSKSWEEFDGPAAPRMDFIFTVCDDAANETCPVWPGHPITAHWGVPDPSVATGSEAEKRLAFADTHRMLSQRIGIFTNLPLSSIDRLALSQQLHEIGQSGAAASN